MFMNEYKHGIDAKGRLIIPSKFREQCGTSIVITRGFEGCLALYTVEGWDEYYSKLLTLPKNNKQSRSLFRMITSRAEICEFDKLGRINIPSKLIDHAKLEKDCAVIGVGDHVEIWNQEVWDEYYDDNCDDVEENYDSLNDI
ncbi:division/cell wall cluster transcriptional repressor MraZ [Tannockella kyphosi]|uniref:division/cell wall cluster transcriptional repressor MraZ n=1 Tax=Tannockella kyphosi TaxID=2899121 RepID=UPI0020122860|nr:division/cell wall cluster transcriptional repressor MraZ [Tannockella kyphosi]